MEMPDDDKYQADLMEIRAAGERASELTRNLLSFSRKQLAQPKALDLNEVVAEAENVEADGDFVYLGVTDTGTGMSDEVKRRLFEPFFTTKELGKGTGLGLATIYGIVQQSAGRIEVTSKLDEGTTFHIYLPRVAAERSTESGAKHPVPAMQSSGTVLVVEDRDAVRRYIRAVLERSGYSVLQAANGPDALRLAEQFAGTIDLLVTDLILPLMNGRELAEKLKMARPGMKVLFTSGYAEETMGSRGIIAN